MEEGPKDARWFHEHMQLPCGSVDVLSLTEVDVSVKEVCAFFGPRSGKNSWKFASYTTPQVTQSILSLYRRVYRATKIPNGEITLQFARGLVLQSRRSLINWPAFAAALEARRARVKAIKSTSDSAIQELVRSPAERRGGSGRRTLAPASENAPLAMLELVKLEALGGILLQKKEGKAIEKKGGIMGSLWTPNDLSNMESVLEFHRTILTSLKVDFEQFKNKKSAIEGKIRRCRIMLSDRRVLIAQSRHKLEKLCLDEVLLGSQVDAAILADPQYEPAIPTGRATSALDAVEFKKTIEDRTLSHHLGEATNAELELTHLEEKYRNCCSRHSTLSVQLENSEKLRVAFADHLQHMGMGVGVSLYPVPISTNPMEPERTAAILNACPFCGLWYKCNNYCTLVCGHTYHPWCLGEHARTSSRCSFPLCEVGFTAKWQATLGLRQVGIPTVKKPLNLGKRQKVQSGGRNGHLDIVSGSQPKHAPAMTLQLNISNLPPLEGSSEHLETTVKHAKEAMTHDSTMTTPSPNQSTVLELKGNSPKACPKCQKRVATILWEKCGHCVCKGCSIGVKACHVCREPVLTWSRIDVPIKSALSELNNSGTQESVV